jgi:hypothetical protein
MSCSDSRLETCRHGEGEAHTGRKDPPGRRCGEDVPAVVLRGQEREASQGLAVLPVDDGRPDRRDAVRVHGAGRIPQRPVPGGVHPAGRQGASTVQGDHPAAEGEGGAVQREQAPAGAEVHQPRHQRRVRVLVLGLRQLQPVAAAPRAGRRVRAAGAMTAHAWWSR